MAIKKTAWGIREKLISIFVLIKVIPLIIVAWIAWEAANSLGNNVTAHVSEMSTSMRDTVSKVGELTIQDSIQALNLRSREAIEQRTTDTAKEVADFLYERDHDILAATRIGLSPESFKTFLDSRNKAVIEHGRWKLAEDGTKWIAAEEAAKPRPKVQPQIEDNRKNFHYRPPETAGTRVLKPLYLEMTFVGTDGQEKIKVATSALSNSKLKDISKRENTLWKAETYFAELGKLKPGDIYVSRMIGPYVGSKVIGPYTPEKAKKAGIPFEPEKSGYAGKENPLGKRFQGLIRWATPVSEQGKIVGYLTLALDHTHIMEFTDHLVPTPERFSAISDAASGNYAFMWDFEGRNISHPRDYFIVGYDPATGDPVVPWLGRDLYKNWKDSGLPYSAWQKNAPTFKGQSLKNKPNIDLIKAGTIALDCRYISFAPQCAGWNNLTQDGGSGSFVIFWSGLWKLTTAAVIPYFSGRYGDTPRGFGYVTIGANVHEFHKPARDSEARIKTLIDERDGEMSERQAQVQNDILDSLKSAASNLIGSTAAMIAIVVVIAIIMAGVLTGRITSIISGIREFQDGNLTHRLAVSSGDEVGQLSQSFNQMADNLQGLIERLNAARNEAVSSSEAKSEFLAKMSHELRTPLNSIIGLSEMLYEEAAEAKDKDYIEPLRRVTAAGQHLLELINNILDLSRIEAGKFVLNRAEVQLLPLLDQVRSTILPLTKSRDNQLNIEIPDVFPTIWTDPIRLRQVLLNLLSNANKFSEHGTITVSLLPSKTAPDDRIVVTVEDTGIGIPADKISSLFLDFSQVNSLVSSSRGGAGLGLAICKRIVEMMGGTIGVESEEGKGSTFWFEIPATQTINPDEAMAS